MYAVIRGAKLFTLLPPTDILYLEEREFQTMKYKIKKKGITSDNDTVSDQATLVGRVKLSDLELTSIGCPSETLNWICTDPDDPHVLEKFPNFHFAHPIRCAVQPGEILYIPGDLMATFLSSFYIFKLQVQISFTVTDVTNLFYCSDVVPSSVSVMPNYCCQLLVRSKV
jgi:Cupin-like domain